MSNITFTYITPETRGVEKEMPLNSEKASNNCQWGILSDILVNNIPQSFLYPLKFIWIDLASLMKPDFFNVKKGNSEYSLFTKENKKTPVIFIGSQSIDEIKDSGILFHKRLFQLDNNIWSYYIHIQPKKKFEGQLKEIIEEISYNYENNFYQLSVTNEYLDFFERQCTQNYIEGGHSSQVLPFVFTPKTLLKKSAKNHFFDEKLKPKIDWEQLKGKKLMLKVLLVDDFANKPLREFDNEGNSSDIVADSIDSVKKENATKGSKAELLYSFWKQFSDDSLSDSEINISLDLFTLETPEAEELKDKYFDIILLDYNFNTTKNGVDFLKRLKEMIDNNNKWNLGPFKKAWIIPTSSFSSAFIDEMRNNEISFMDSHYNLSRGADFINTPNLFLFYFTRTINEIVHIALETKLNIDKILRTLNEVKPWDKQSALKNDYYSQFQQHIINKQNVNFLLKAKEGILKDIIEEPEEFCRQIYFYEQLLYNLAYRNYEGNEEIIIFHDLLKKSITKDEQF